MVVALNQRFVFYFFKKTSESKDNHNSLRYPICKDIELTHGASLLLTSCILFPYVYNSTHQPQLNTRRLAQPLRLIAV